jgi:hypothetical protein
MNDKIAEQIVKSGMTVFLGAVGLLITVLNKKAPAGTIPIWAGLLAVATGLFFHAVMPLIASKPSGPGEYLDRFLRAFRYFCSRSSRETVDLSIHDLNLDIKEMRAEGRSGLFIKSVVVWQSASTVVAVVWTSIVEPIVKVVKAFTAK